MKFNTMIARTSKTNIMIIPVIITRNLGSSFFPFFFLFIISIINKKTPVQKLTAHNGIKIENALHTPTSVFEVMGNRAKKFQL